MPPLDRREVLVGTAALGLSSLARGRTRDPLPRKVLLFDLDDVGRELLTRAIALGLAPNLRNAIETGRSYPVHWAAPMCSPFRARVLTGLDAYRPGNLVGRVISPNHVFAGPTGTWMPFGLPGARVKIGKWHLSGGPTFPDNLIPKGYDRFTGIQGGVEGGSYYNWTEWTADASGSSSTVQTQHHTTRTAGLALAELALGTELIHTSFLAVHAPLELPPNDEPPGAVYSGTSPFQIRLAMLSHMDYWIGLLLTEAIPRGYVVVIVCDNGTDGLGKGTCLESGSNTNLIVVGDCVNVGSSSRLVQATDLWATVRRLRGDTSGMTALDSLDFCDDFLAGAAQIAPPRQFMTVDWFPILGLPPDPAKWSRMIRDARWKYVDQRYKPNGTQPEPIIGLWDLLTDPTEKVNLLSAPLSGEAQAAKDLLVANLQG